MPEDRGQLRRQLLVQIEDAAGPVHQHHLAARVDRRPEEVRVQRPLRGKSVPGAEIAHHPIQTLSYGLRKAVDLARALASRPELLLLDEPVAGLTAQEGQAMAAVIRGARDRQWCAVLMVEHKMDVVMSTCDRIAVMAAGAKIFEGTAAEVQADPEVRRVYLGEP